MDPTSVPAADTARSAGQRSGIEQLGYEQARDELVEVVRALEVGGLSLDDALALWERGEQLARRCEQQLAGARDRVEAALRADHPEPADATPDSAD